MNKILFIILLLIISCTAKKSKYEPSTKVQTIEDKAQLYCEKSKDLEDNVGFVGECGDQMLFNSLRAVSCDVDTDIYTAKDPQTNQWNRDGQRACYKDKKTKTPFSRDMLMGLMFYLWQQHDDRALKEANGLIDFINNHKGYICDAPEPERTSRCFVNPSLKATIYELIFKLGGSDNIGRKVPTVEVGSVKGYEAHLASLHILLRGLMTGSVPGYLKDVVKTFKDREPENLLFRAIYAKFDDGKMDSVVKDLEDNHSLFPDDQLPTNHDRCEAYLWQREYGNDWKPCQGSEVKFAGIDYTFLVSLINDDIEHSFMLTVPIDQYPYRIRN